MADVKMENAVLQDVRLLFRNFAGREQQFNSAGDRNFCVILEESIADDMQRAGWNVKSLRPREEGDTPERYIKVKVNYGKGRPPRVVLISSQGRVDLGPDEVEMLDFADIKQADVILNPYAWTIKSSGSTGVSAYLKTIFVTLNEDELELKYQGVQNADVGLSIHDDEDDD